MSLYSKRCLDDMLEVSDEELQLRGNMSIDRVSTDFNRTVTYGGEGQRVTHP